MLDQPLKQWLTGRKRGEDRNTKIWISRERKEFFIWNKKNIFHSFWRAIMWLKIGNWWKIVDASFNMEGITFQTCNWIQIYFFKELLPTSWLVCNGWPIQPLLLLVIYLSKTRKWHFSTIQINLLQEMLMICTGEILFEWLNNYHPKIKPNIDLNPKNFLNTQLNCIMANGKSIEISQHDQ